MVSPCRLAVDSELPCASGGPCRAGVSSTSNWLSPAACPRPPKSVRLRT